MRASAKTWIENEQDMQRVGRFLARESAAPAEPRAALAQNFSLLNRIALNLLKQKATFKRGVKGKRLKAEWNHPYLLKLPLAF